MRGSFRAHGEKSRRARTWRILPRFNSAFARSAEPSGNSDNAAVIVMNSLRSSIRGIRISSLIVSTLMIFSVIFDRANRGLLTEAGCDRGGGCIARDGNGEDERVSACSHPAAEGCEMARKKDGFGVVLGGNQVLRNRCQLLPRPRVLGSNLSPPNV